MAKPYQLARVLQIYQFQLPSLMIPSSIYGTAQDRNSTLKRDKNAFHLSTAAFSTTSMGQPQNNVQYQPDFNNNRLPSFSRDQPHQDIDNNVFAKINITGPQHQNLQNMEAFKKLQKLIRENNQNTGKQGQFLQHRTHSYFLSQSQQQENYHYHVTADREFPPKIVKQIYDKQLINSTDGNIQFHSGNLEKCGYLYFSIQKLLILIKVSNFEEGQQHEEPIIIQLQQHALFVKQIVVSDLQIQDIERHPFGQQSLVFVVWLKWEIQFFSYEPRNLIKVRNLDMKFQTSCQAAFHIDYCQRGNLYYLSQHGQIGRVQLFYRSKIGLFSINKRYSIREHFFQFKHDTKRKRQMIGDFGFLSNLKQLYKDIKYYWSQKKTKGLQIYCNKQRDLIYTLVETSVRTKSNANKFQNHNHRQIRIYSINEAQDTSFFSKIQNSMYGSPPNLLLQLTEENLFKQIGVHLFSSMNLQKFQVAGFHVPQKSLHFTGDKRVQTNLIVVLSNGSRLQLNVSSAKLILNQLINMPNFDAILKASSTNNVQNLTIAQKEPVSFKLIQFHFHNDGSFAILALYRRTALGILLTKCLGKGNEDKEEIQIFWEQSLESDQQAGSIFITLSDYKIYPDCEMQNSIHKNELKKYKNFSATGQQEENTHKIGLNSSGFRQNAENRQVLHYPYQYLFVQKDRMKGVIKLRPVDTLLGTIQKELNSYSSNFGMNTLLSNESEIRNLIKKINLNLGVTSSNERTQRLLVLASLVQIYCDIDGAYYFEQLELNRRNISQGDTKTISFNKQRIESDRRSQQSSDILSNFGQGARLTQKLNNINAFRKYNYSDLCTSENFMTNQYSLSPIKIKSDNSIMKLVEKIIFFLVSLGKTEKASGSYNKRFDDGDWVIASEEFSQPQVLRSEIQEGILLYLSRLMSCIWNLKIKMVQGFVFIYLGDICKKVLELLARIQEHSMIYRLPSSFTELQRLCSSIIEYNTMLNALTLPTDMLYGEGLGKEKQKFQQLIFYSLQKKSDLSSAVNEWRDLFPNFFNLKLFRAVKLKAQIASLPKSEDRKQLIIKNYQLMPHYLLFSYVRDGTLDKKQFSVMLEMDKQKDSVGLKNINHLVMTDSLDPSQKIDYAVSEVAKNTVRIDEKEFLINYAMENLENVRNKDRSYIQKKRSELQQLRNLVKIQDLISRYLKKTDKNDSISPKTMNLVNYVLMTPGQLKGLVKELKNPMISIIYYCSFWDNSQNISHMLRELALDSKQQDFIPSGQFRDTLHKIFNTFSKKVTQRIPLIPLLTLLDQIAYKQVNAQDLTSFIRRYQEAQLKRTFWVPFFLSQYGWSQMAILDHYIELFSKQYLKVDIKTQKQFLYYWLSAFTHTKFAYTEGVRVFQIATQMALKFNQDPRSDTAFLVQFAQERLVY